MARTLFAKSLFRGKLRDKGEHSRLLDVIWRMEALLVRLFWQLCRVLGPERSARFGAWAFAALGPRNAKQRHVLGNLAVVMPDASTAERQAVSREVWGNFGAVMAEYAFLERFTLDPERLEIAIAPGCQAVLDAEGPVIIVSGHFANWETICCGMKRLGRPLTVVYAAQSNPYLDAALQDQRAALDAELHPKEQALRAMLKAVRQGRSIGLLPDQRVDGGLLLDLCGRPAPTTASAAGMALRLEAPIVPVRVRRLGPARLRLEIAEPLEVFDGEGEEALMQRINDLFTTWIRDTPGQWMCTKRRWPREDAQDVA